MTVSDRLTIGTTTASGLSILTLESTSTVAIPLTIRSFTGQVANLFQIVDSSNTTLLTVNNAGLLALPNILLLRVLRPERLHLCFCNGNICNDDEPCRDRNATTSALTVSNNATVGGTLGVTGAATFTSLATGNGGFPRIGIIDALVSFHLNLCDHHQLRRLSFPSPALRIHGNGNICDDHCCIIDRHQREYL